MQYKDREAIADNLHDCLFIGKENARSGHELCDFLGVSSREVTLAVERLRRRGCPICSSTNMKNPGYYIAADKKEMEQFCRSLYHRAGEILKTRRACMDAMAHLPGNEVSSNGL